MPTASTKTKSNTAPQPYLVEYTSGGYRVVRFDGAAYEPVNENVYFHVTSAYAAMGRLQHKDNLLAHNIKTDPAKAPVKGKKEAQK